MLGMVLLYCNRASLLHNIGNGEGGSLLLSRQSAVIILILGFGIWKTFLYNTFEKFFSTFNYSKF